ncbi:MAG: hypothetical protein J5506_11115 [Prevotella sp.]|nr:hypothetical protein [Prevotella sp.]
MKYRITKETRPTLKNYGRWKAVAVHENTVETARIVREVSRRVGCSRGTVIAVLEALSFSVGSHLRHGDRVRLDDWGLLKLEIDSQKVDNPDEFDQKRHIRAVRLHVLAESRHGRQPLYHNLRFTRADLPARASRREVYSHRGTEETELKDVKPISDSSLVLVLSSVSDSLETNPSIFGTNPSVSSLPLCEINLLHETTNTS